MPGVIGPGVPSAPSVSATVVDGSKRPVWTWTEPANHFAGLYRLSLDDSTFADDDGRTTDRRWQPGADLSVGSHTLYVQAKGTGGLWSDSGSATIAVTSGEEHITDAPTVTVDDDPVRPTWSWDQPEGGNGIFRFRLNDSELDGLGDPQTKQLAFRWKADLADAAVLFVQAQSTTGAWSEAGSAWWAPSYTDQPTPPSSPLSDSLQVDLELEFLGGRNTNDLTQFWDSSGNERHGSSANGFTVNSGLIGNALYGEEDSSQQLLLSGSSVTWRSVSCWVYNSIASSGSTNGAMQIVWNFGTTRVELNICANEPAMDGPIYLIKKGGVVRAVGSPITKPLGWHHIVFARTETEPFWAIWIDGVASAVENFRSSLEWNIPYNSSSLIGYQTNTYMDLVRGWSRALSAAEVAELYNDGVGI